MPYLESAVPSAPFWLSPSTATSKMLVIALGLPSPKDDELRTNLKRLSSAYVTFEQPSSMGTNEGQVWHRLYTSKYGQGSVGAGSITAPTSISRHSFEAVLGPTTAITGITAVMFGPELVRAYPEAKVVLNRQRDGKAWEKDFRLASSDASRDWTFGASRLIKAQGLWSQSLREKQLQAMFPHGIDKGIKGFYEEYYDEIEAWLRHEQVDFLNWSVEDGSEALARFLGKST